MPRHLISDAHEWINEIPTVHINRLAKPQPRERAWDSRRGKKTMLSLTLIRHSVYSLFCMSLPKKPTKTTVFAVAAIAA